MARRNESKLTMKELAALRELARKTAPQGKRIRFLSELIEKAVARKERRAA